MAIGEGAGVGAALAVKHGVSSADADVKEIREILKTAAYCLNLNNL
ncbi:MAG: hypothetical protein ACM3S4_02600 [Burkholderiales bacterium]